MPHTVRRYGSLLSVAPASFARRAIAFAAATDKADTTESILRDSLTGSEIVATPDHITESSDVRTSCAANATDAETELTRARIDLVNAHIGARIALAELEHAIGRDAGTLK